MHILSWRRILLSNFMVCLEKQNNKKHATLNDPPPFFCNPHSFKPSPAVQSLQQIQHRTGEITPSLVEKIHRHLMDVPEACSETLWRSLLEPVRSRSNQDKKGAYIALVCLLLLLGLMEYMRALSPFISGSNQSILVGFAPLASAGVYIPLASASEMAAPNEVSS
jgi:hypothetical protein